MDLNEELRRNHKKMHLTEQQLDERIIKDFFRGATAKFTGLLKSISGVLTKSIASIVGPVKRIFTKRIGKTEYFVYEQKGPKGRMYGFLYPDAVKKAVTGAKGGANQTTLAKAYFKGQNPRKPEQIVVAFDKRFKGNVTKSNTNVKAAPVKQNFADIPENFLGKMSGEILNEAPLSKSFLHRQSSEYDRDRAETMAMKGTFQSVDVPVPNDIDMADNVELQEYLNTAKVGPEAVGDILSEFLTALAFRADKDSDAIPSLLIMGFPGGGKTAIIKAFAKKRFKIHILEIASIYKEILGGFPTIEDGGGAQALEDRVKKLKADPDRTIASWDVDGDDSGSKVRMKAADIFPEEDGQIHVFFLDEYNRDAEKMAASMNLMLSGSIGNQYQLPLKTIVVAAGNLGIDIDKVDVQRLDNATFDRFNASIMLKKDMIAGAEYAGAQTDYSDKGISRSIEKNIEDTAFVPIEKQAEYNIKMGGAISSMDIFIGQMTQKYGAELNGAGWQEELGLNPLESEYVGDEDERDPDDQYLLTGRKLETINRRVKNRVVRDWIEAKEGMSELADPKDITGAWNKGSEKYKNFTKPEDWEKAWKDKKQTYISRGIPSPAALYMHIMQWHFTYLPTVLKQTLGGNPGELISKIRSTAEVAIQEANQVTPYDIIFGYAAKRILYGHTMKIGKKQQQIEAEEFMSRVKMMPTLGDTVMRSLADAINENDTEAKISKMIKKVTGHTWAEVKADLADSSKHAKPGGKPINIPDAINFVAFNLHLFISNIDLSLDRIAILVTRMRDFGFTIEESGGKNEVVSGKSDEKMNKAAKDAIGTIYGALVQKNKNFQESRIISANANFDELDKLDNEKSESIIDDGMNALFEKLKG